MKTEFKGTKGKWEISNKKTHGRQMVDLGEFKGSIDVWYHNGDSMTKEEAKANALLISKAPEMLRMIEKIIYNSDVPNEIYDEAKQLIKEATEL